MSNQRHGGAKSPEWKTWCSIRRRGEAVCPEWLGRAGFAAFIASVGPRPTDKHELRRLDLERGFVPDNVEWMLRPAAKPKVLSGIHGNYRHGGCRSKTWNSWMAMRNRCLDPNNNRYAMYGGRGIKICERWLGRDGFSAFRADMGERPDGMSIDRIDVDGNYEPSNCRWATTTQQARNTRWNKLEEHEPSQIRWLLSEGYTQTEIARFYEVSQSTISLIALGKTWKEDSQ